LAVRVLISPPPRIAGQDRSIAPQERTMTETPPRISRPVVLNDPFGLHLRAAAKLVVLSKSFRSEIRVICQGTVANARSILDLATLGAGRGTRLEIVAHGPDAEQAVDALTGLIVAGLDAPADRAVAAA
jgi:phosphocarrier protein HPr